MICPFKLSQYTYPYSDEEKKEQLGCEGEACAWHMDNTQECALHALVRKSTHHNPLEEYVEMREEAGLGREMQRELDRLVDICTYYEIPEEEISKLVERIWESREERSEEDGAPRGSDLQPASRDDGNDTVDGTAPEDLIV